MISVSKSHKNKIGNLLANNQKPTRGQVLIDKEDRSKLPFEISIRHSLDSHFSFKQLSPKGLSSFHQFVEKTVGKSLSWGKVDQTMLRIKNGNPWRDEKVDGKDRRVAHYDMPGNGRIFGYKEGNDFIIWKIDPNHEVDK